MQSTRTLPGAQEVPVSVPPHPPSFRCNSGVLAHYDADTMRAADGADVDARRADAYLVGYRLSLGCLASQDGLYFGERDGRAAERERRNLDRARTAERERAATDAGGQDR